MKVSEIGGAKFMTREEFKRYGAQLREKTHQYKKLKGELAELRAESVCLHRTEQILRGRATDIDAFNAEQESRKGVQGYRGVQDKLEAASERTAEVDKAVDELPQVQELQQQPGKVAERTPSNNDAAVEPPPQKLPRLCVTFNAKPAQPAPPPADEPAPTTPSEQPGSRPKRKAFVAAAAAMEGEIGRAHV